MATTNLNSIKIQPTTFVYYLCIHIIILSFTITNTNAQCTAGSGNCNACHGNDSVSCIAASSPTIDCNHVPVPSPSWPDTCQIIQPNCSAPECNNNNRCRCKQTGNPIEPICCGVVPSGTPPDNPCKWTSFCAFKSTPTQPPSLTLIPSITPTKSPTLIPSITPTKSPALIPSISPTKTPSISPTKLPSISPTK
eukprot:67613_1